MAQRLLNKVAVVTGAGSGIGRAVAARFLHEGARVVAFGRTRKSLEEVAQTSPARSLAVEGDVTRSEDLRRLAAATMRRFGQVDVVVPDAGIARALPLSDADAEAVEALFAVNVTGAVQTVRTLLPRLREGAAIVFLTEQLGGLDLPPLGLFQASKAALTSLVGSLASEFAPRRVRVNAVAPGPTATPFWSKLGLPESELERLKSQISERLVAGEFADPSDVAEAVVYLVSDAARHVSGEEIAVGGGRI